MEGNARYLRGHSAHLRLQAYPEHACAGPVTISKYASMVSETPSKRIIP